MLYVIVNEAAKFIPGLPIEAIQVGTICISEFSDHGQPPCAEGPNATRPSKGGDMAHPPPSSKAVTGVLHGG